MAVDMAKYYAAMKRDGGAVHMPGSQAPAATVKAPKRTEAKKSLASRFSHLRAIVPRPRETEAVTSTETPEEIKRHEAAGIAAKIIAAGRRGVR